MSDCSGRNGRNQMAFNGGGWCQLMLQATSPTHFDLPATAKYSPAAAS